MSYLKHVLLIFICLCPQIVRADVIASAFGRGQSQNFDTGDVRDVNFVEVSGVFSGIDELSGSRFAGSAFALGKLIPTFPGEASSLGLKLYNVADSEGLSSIEANTASVVRWEDRIRVSGGPQSDFLKISVRAHAYVGFNTYHDSLSTKYIEANFGVAALPIGGILEAGRVNSGYRPWQWENHAGVEYGLTQGWMFDYPSGPTSSESLYVYGGSSLLSSLLQGDTAGNPLTDFAERKEISFTQDLLIPYVSQEQAYVFNLGAYSTTKAWGRGKIAVDARNTIDIINVVNADGSSVLGGFTFDSGYKITAIPEPSSLMMLGSLVLWKLRRRTR